MTDNTEERTAKTNIAIFGHKQTCMTGRMFDLVHYKVSIDIENRGLSQPRNRDMHYMVSRNNSTQISIRFFKTLTVQFNASGNII